MSLKKVRFSSHVIYPLCTTVVAVVVVALLNQRGSGI